MELRTAPSARGALLCLALCACRTEGAISPVQVAGVGTLASGDAVVLLRQSWQSTTGNNAIYEKTGALVVHADGRSEPIGLPQPLLAPDCSDEPAGLGACIVATKTTSGDDTMWTFALGDGSELVASDVATSQSVTRMAADGTAQWTLYGVARPDDTIRGGTLLLINSRFASASKMAIDTGAESWTVMPPASL